MTGSWVMPMASWLDVGLIAGVLLGVPVLLWVSLVVLDRRVRR